MVLVYTFKVVLQRDSDDKATAIKAGARRLYEIWDHYDNYGKAGYWAWHRRRANKIVVGLLKKMTGGLSPKRILNLGSHGETFECERGVFTHLNVLGRWLPKEALSVVADAEDLPFPGDKFDACTCMDSVINYCRANLVLNECARVLQPGGLLILDFDNCHTLEFRGSEAFCAGNIALRGDLPGVPHEMWFYSGAYMCKLLLERGFTVTSIHGSHYVSCAVQDTHHTLAKILMMLDPALDSISPLRLFAGNLIITAELSNKRAATMD